MTNNFICYELRKLQIFCAGRFCQHEAAIKENGSWQTLKLEVPEHSICCDAGIY